MTQLNLILKMSSCDMFSKSKDLFKAKQVEYVVAAQ